MRSRINFILIISLLFSIKLIAIDLKKYNKDISVEREALLHRLIADYSERFELDPLDLYATFIIETHCRNMVGDNGRSLGYGQIQLNTIRHMQREYEGCLDMPIINNEEDILLNIESQVFYIVLLKKYLTYKFDTRGAVLAYNCGEGNYIKGRYNSNYWRKYKKVYEELRDEHK